MGKTAPAVKFNLWFRPYTELRYIMTVFNYYENGKKRAQYRNLVPNTSIHPKFWDKVRQRASVDRSNPTHHIKVNQLLDDISGTIMEIYRDFNAGCISPKDLELELAYRMKWQPRPEPESETNTTPTLFEFIDLYCRERDGGKRGTEKILQTWANLLKAFSMERYRRLLDYHDIDATFFAAFRKWCYAPPRSHSINYFHKGTTVIRQFMREAERRKFHDNRDYQFFTVKKMATTKIALSFEELETLYNLDLSGHPGLIQSRDLFLIGCYTGLRFSDFSRIQAENVEQGEDGRKYITIVTQKTGTLVTIPLLPIPEALLQKYGYNAPKLTNQYLNRNLKELGKLAGLTGKMFVINTAGGVRNDEILEKSELLSSHVARRSFATNFYKQGKTPIHDLMRITGHATEKQFMQYIKIDGKESAANFARTQEAAPMTVVKKAG